MKHFLVWVMLVVIFDGTTCVALRTVLDPPRALTMADSTPVAYERRTNHIDPNMTVAMSSKQPQELQEELCATPVVSQACAEMPAQPADILYADGQCPQLDSHGHRGMTIDELNDLKDQLCPRATPTSTACEQVATAQVPARSAADVKAVTDASCGIPPDEMPSEPQRTGN